MNTGSIAMTPEKASDIALITPQDKKGQDVGANELGASFSKVLSEVSDESVTDKNSGKTTENSSQNNDKDAVNMSNLSGALGILPVGIVLSNHQAKCNETGKVNLQVQNVEQLSNINVNTNMNMITLSATSELRGDSLQVPVSAAAAVPLTIPNDGHSLLLTPEEMLQLKTKLEISMNDKSQANIINSKDIQPATATENVAVQFANVAVNSNEKTLEIGLKAQTEKSSITETPIKNVNDAATMGMKISEDIPRVQYSAYGMKIVPGKQDTAEQPITNQPLTQAGDAEKVSNVYVESTVAIDNMVQDKASLSEIKQDMVLQSATTQNDAGKASNVYVESTVAIDNNVQDKASLSEIKQDMVLQSATAELVSDGQDKGSTYKKQAVATQNDAINAIDDSKQLPQPNVKVNDDINSLQNQPPDNNSVAIFSEANSAAEGLSKQIGAKKSDTHRHSTDEAPKYSQIQVQTNSNGFRVKDVKASAEQPVADKYAVVSQIVEHAKLINRSNNSEMVIKLQPEHLGELTLKVLVENGVVSTTFHSNNPEVRSVIEASLNQLRQEMSNQGLKVDYVGVYAGLSQFSSQQQRESQQQPAYKFLNKKQVTSEFDQAMDIVSQPKSIDSIDGIDYRI